jgi:hypothetical protein
VTISERTLSRRRQGKSRLNSPKWKWKAFPSSLPGNLIDHWNIGLCFRWLWSATRFLFFYISWPWFFLST